MIFTSVIQSGSGSVIYFAFPVTVRFPRFRRSVGPVLDLPGKCIDAPAFLSSGEVFRTFLPAVFHFSRRIRTVFASRPFIGILGLPQMTPLIPKTCSENH